MAVKLTSEGINFPDGSTQERNPTNYNEVLFYNQKLVTQGPHTCCAHRGASGTWTVPTDASVITFHAWGGGGSGAGQCCQNCLCDQASCGAYGGVYSRKTLRKCDNQFSPGEVYTWCYGDGGNGNSDGNGGWCYTVCCDAPRGCASYVTGRSLSNFCAPGGRGGYTIYCTCGCANSANRYDSLNDLGLVIGTNVDFAHVGSKSEFFKTSDECDCRSRQLTTSKSFGLENSNTYYLQDSAAYCGCSDCTRGFNQIASAGMDSMKSYCGNYNCNCNGTPGKPGMIKIEWQ